MDAPTALRDEADLLAVRSIDGRQRFYPPGQHPATYRLREHLALLERVGLRDGEAADYVRAEIAKFERAEERAKFEYRVRILQKRRAA